MSDNSMMIFVGNEDLKAYRSSFLGWAIFALVTCGIGAIFALPAILVIYLRAKTTTYKISSERVQIEAGILSKAINTMELWRVKDLRFQQTMTQRIFGECTILMVTQDASHPLLHFNGFTAQVGRDVFEKIQDTVSQSRKKGGVLGLTS